MIPLFKDLYRYKRVKIYDTKKSKHDNRLNGGYDYKDELMQMNLSEHIFRSEYVRFFLEFINDYFYNVIGRIKTLDNWKNFTVKPEDKNRR
jgi:hypothetical protein